jgi:hypothetical protein
MERVLPLEDLRVGFVSTGMSFVSIGVYRWDKESWNIP